MRDLKASSKNELVINDARSGSNITFFYRNPTTKEEVAYQAGLFKKKGAKLKVNVTATRIEFAIKIITGFGEDCFGYDGQPISSDPNKEIYDPEWRDRLTETAADLLNTFAFTIFEGNKVKADTGDFFLPEFEDEEGNEGEEKTAADESPKEDEEPPLESSSGD